jgi:CubicO group peptidase (beta-lactamase class C family)
MLWPCIAAVIPLAGCSNISGATLHQVAWDQFTLADVKQSSPPPPIAAAADADDAAKFGALVTYLQGQLTAAHVPGAAVAVLLDGRLAFEAGIGVRRAGGDAPVTPGTLFRIGSTGKLITTAAVMTLVEQGEIDLDRPVNTTVSWFTRRAGDDAGLVTLRLALAHAAGIPDENRFDCPPTSDRLRTYFVAHGQDPLLAPPGTVFDYSNGGYLVAGALIEDVTGQRFEDYIDKTVFAPAGMVSATYDLDHARAAGLADGHDANGRPRERPSDCALLDAPGGVLASVEDYAHLLETLLAGGKGMLRPESVAALERDEIATQERPDRRYAMGLFSMSYKGLRVLAHPGDYPGYSSFFAFVPERRFAVVVLANADSGVPPAAMAALDLFLDLPDAPPPTPTSSPSAWRDYEGEYADPAGALGRFSIALNNDRLEMTLEGGQPGPVPGDLTGVFWRGSDGHVEYFVTRIGIARRRLPKP